MSDEETKIQNRKSRRERWTKGLIIAAFGTAFAGLAVLPIIASVCSIAIAQIPVIKNHEARLATMEQSAVTNGIILQNRFDRQDEQFARQEEQLQSIKNILLHRQQTALNSTNSP